MAVTHLPLILPLLVLLHCHYLGPSLLASAVGVNYGTLGSNLPPPKKVAELLQSTLIDKVKIYDTDPDILQAFANTGIDLLVAVENRNVVNISKDTSSAEEWLSDRVLPFVPATSVVAICVGNEYLTAGDDRLEPNALVQAMRNLHEVNLMDLQLYNVMQVRKMTVKLIYIAGCYRFWCRMDWTERSRSRRHTAWPF